LIKKVFNLFIYSFIKFFKFFKLHTPEFAEQIITAYDPNFLST